MGSRSDLPVVEGAFKIFEEFGIGYEAHALSAHRTPTEAAGFAANAESNGFKVIICAAGMAAHLGLNTSETMAFGDGGNDIPMLRHAGVGVAMGNAASEVQNAADYVTTSVDEDGILNALKHFGIL